jgi:hypothetical protein
VARVIIFLWNPSTPSSDPSTFTPKREPFQNNVVATNPIVPFAGGEKIEIRSASHPSNFLYEHEYMQEPAVSTEKATSAGLGRCL